MRSTDETSWIIPVEEARRKSRQLKGQNSDRELNRERKRVQKAINDSCKKGKYFCEVVDLDYLDLITKELEEAGYFVKTGLISPFITGVLGSRKIQVTTISWKAKS